MVVLVVVFVVVKKGGLVVVLLLLLVVGPVADVGGRSWSGLLLVLLLLSMTRLSSGSSDMDPRLRDDASKAKSRRIIMLCLVSCMMAFKEGRGK